MPDHNTLPRFALSIRQPWAWAIINAGKDVENRDWRSGVRGPVCIHAGKGMTLHEWDDAAYTMWKIFGVLAPDAKAISENPAERLLFGGIIGVAEITDCVSKSDSPWFFGSYGFTLANPRPIPFIPVKGALGFFDWRKNLQGAGGAA